MGHHLTATVTLLFLLVGGATILATFVTTPTSVNATLGSTATFTCSATIGTIDWRVNGSLLTELNRTNIKTSYVEGTHFMNLPATKEYNNTAVVCEVILRGPLSITISDPAVLRVQGLLDAVCNLRSESLGQIIHLTWDAPFSLNITGVDPDIWYRLDITVTDDPLNMYFISRIVNVPEFNFTVGDYNDTSTSVVYAFQVTPINGAGNGTRSHFVYGYFIGPPRSITPDIVKTSGSDDPLSVNFIITYKNIPPGEMPDQIQIFAETVDDGNKAFYCTDDIPVTSDIPGSSERVLIQLNASTPTCKPGSCSLEPHRRYKAIIAAKNQAGGANSTGDICFCTCEPQICTAKVFDGSRPKAVNISCKFTETVGYLLILSPQTNSSQEIFVIASKMNTSNSDWKISIPVVPHDNYTVFHYDLRSIYLPLLSDDSTGDRLYIPASGKENVTVLRKSKCDSKNISVMDEGNAGGSEVLLVPGTMLEVPDIADADVKLCISIEPDPSSDTIVVFAHHIDDPEKLLTYFLDVTNCTTAPSPGSYFFAVFVQNEDKIMKAPITPPTIFFNTVPITSPIPPVLPTNTTYDSQSRHSSLVVVTVTVTVSALLVTVAAVVTVAVCVKTKVKKVKKEKLKKCEIEMQPNQAYETVSRPCPSKSATQIHTEPCPAYEDVVVQACN